MMNEYEKRRLEKIKQNKKLFDELDLPSAATTTRHDAPKAPSSKRRKLDLPVQPVRASARIAATPIKPEYDGDTDSRQPIRNAVSRNIRKQSSRSHVGPLIPKSSSPLMKEQDAEDWKQQWTSWVPIGPSPSRDEITAELVFEDWPNFSPNKSPEEMLREGVFGGSFFRPLYSKRLGVTIQGDWQELPREWIEGLRVETFLTNPEYNADVNKYKAACGQSIEQWEDNGWIDHRFDARGWFQWYCRFYQGRRCEDDERQVGRWARCAGTKGRWRRALLKKYGQLGIRSVMADMDDDVSNEDKPEVSPTVHQTCLQWAFEVRQGDLDEYWNSL